MSNDQEPSKLIQAVAHAASGLAARSTIPFVGEKDNVAFIGGTGVLFEIGGRHFIITASHVAESINSLGLGVPLSDKGSEVWRPQAGQVHLARRDEHDVAVVHLDPDQALIAALKAHREFLTLGNVLLRPSDRIERYYVHGFPHARARYAEGELWGAPFRLVTGSYRGRTDDVETPVNPLLHLLLDYEAKVTTEAGEGGSVESLGGISGCAVWAIMEDRPGARLWTAGDNVKVVAVETGVLKSRGWIRATRWVVVANALKKIDPTLGPLLDESYRSPA